MVRAIQEQRLIQMHRTRLPIFLIILCAIVSVTTGYLVAPYWREFREIRGFVSTVEANRYDLLAVERACETMQKQGKGRIIVLGLERVLRHADGDVRAAGLATTASIGLDAEPLLPLIRRIAKSETPEAEIARGVLSHCRRVSRGY